MSEEDDFPTPNPHSHPPPISFTSVETYPSTPARSSPPLFPHIRPASYQDSSLGHPFAIRSSPQSIPVAPNTSSDIDNPYNTSTNTTSSNHVNSSDTQNTMPHILSRARSERSHAPTALSEVERPSADTRPPFVLNRAEAKLLGIAGIGFLLDAYDLFIINVSTLPFSTLPYLQSCFTLLIRRLSTM
jgi:hypothetical protein